jgi:menaquinone-dependent protoporphyrinogen IX oxidase
MQKILVAYASAHGSTGQIGQFLGDLLSLYDVQVTVRSVNEPMTDLESFDAVVMGSPIHGGMWLREFSNFAEKLQRIGGSRKHFMFITCVRVMEEGGLQHVHQNYVHRPTLDALKVADIEVFAGKLELSQINWEERWTLSARYDGQEMPGTMQHDYRDWQRIAAWGHWIAKDLGLAPKLEQRLVSR